MQTRVAAAWRRIGTSETHLLGVSASCAGGAGEGDEDVIPVRVVRVSDGFELRRDGTSRSFMPLHGLELRWDAVRFDSERLEVTVQAEGVRYVYRVPHGGTRR